MNGWYKQAADKLNAEIKKVTGQKETVMKNAVKDALLEFSKQDEEFAQAIAQGGSFPDCMKAVAKGVATSPPQRGGDIFTRKRPVSVPPPHRGGGVTQ